MGKSTVTNVSLKTSRNVLKKNTQLRTADYTNFRVEILIVRMAIHFFVNFDIFKRLYLAFFWVYLPQTWGFCKAWYALYDYVDE